MAPRPDPGATFWEAAGLPPWIGTLACGLLWGCAITGVETLREPPADLPLRDLIGFMLLMLASWCLSGAIWATMTKLVLQRPSARRLVSAWLSGAIVGTGLMVGLDVLLEFFPLSRGLSPIVGRSTAVLDAIFVHVLWINVVFGGFYVTGYAAFQRAVRSRRRLALLQAGLSGEAALFEEARLHTLRGAVQSDILIEAVGALRSRYQTDPHQADALLERLVAYLRAASGGARRGTTVPGATVAHLALRAALVNLVPAPSCPDPSQRATSKGEANESRR